ncbi:MAG: hypothetical protein HFF40_10880 [Lawsonibacter sp.]|jgi:hypothetical protein|nr:hypothetical protein [Lawsonibacter sp.]MCI9269341.1 hypothetical protein [Lawsonibacter sp.]
MNTLPSIFLNDTIDAELEAFCASDPEFVQAEQDFKEIARQIAQLVGFDRYDAFEKRFTKYMYRTSDLYYLYGLGLRQDILRAMGK